MKYFQYDQVNESIKLEDESILMVREFTKLLTPARNKTTKDKTGKKREKAYKEMKFMYLYYDWGSPYFEFDEDEKYAESLADSGLTEEDLDDTSFKLACEKYDYIQNSSKIGKLLKAAFSSIDKLTFYLQNIDLNERDPLTGKPIFKAKDLILEVKGASALIDGVKTLEREFKKDLESDSGLRGDKEAGMFD